ncbi:MAG: hypothetical protein R2771_01320 [Saprospiraceae bacterium]
MLNSKIETYKLLVSQCREFELKGKNMLYTSANGYMFSQINKEGELGIRFPKDIQEKYMQEFNTSNFTSYGATMKGYIKIPDSMWDDHIRIVQLLEESYQYVMSLDPK